MRDRRVDHDRRISYAAACSTPGGNTVRPLLLTLLLTTTAPAMAQDRGPGAVIGGSADTVVGGKPAARSGDQTSKSDAVIGSSSNVIINGKPAAVQGDRTGCGGVVISGSSNVFINGKPMARSGDATSGCPGR
ncbi:hypothetical protein BH11PSE4_BH11PSE4_27970 [soil metagenome]